MAGRDDLIKFMTQQLVTYMETPGEERKQKREAAKAAKEPWLTKWFGMAPLGIALWWKNRASKQELELEQKHELLIEK